MKSGWTRQDRCGRGESVLAQGVSLHCRVARVEHQHQEVFLRLTTLDFRTDHAQKSITKGITGTKKPDRPLSRPHRKCSDSKDLILVGVTGFEPATSWSRTNGAPNR